MSAPKFRSSNSNIDEVKAIFKDLKNRLSNEKDLQKKVDEAFVKVLSKDGRDKGIRDAIDGLNARIIQLDKNFNLIADNVYKVDLEYKQDFEPKWVAIRTQWRDLLHKSRKNTLATTSHLGAFASHIDSIQKIKTEKDKQEALKELKNFIALPDPRGRKFPTQGSDAIPFNVMVTESSDVLADLKKELEDFKVIFDKFADAEKVAMDAKVKDLKEKITKVEEELTEALELLEETEGLVHLSHNMMTAGGLVMVFIHCTPIHILVELLEVVVLVGGSIAIKDCMNNVTKLQVDLLKYLAELAQLEAKLEKLMSIKSMVDDVPDIANVFTKIDYLDGIWLAVSRDAYALQQALESDEKTFEAMRDRIVQMMSFYESISVGLARYSNGQAYLLSN